jgi:hypothetical protein
MSDPVVTADATETDAPEEQVEQSKDWESEAARWKRISRDNEAKAKANAAAAQELEQLREAQKSEQQKSAERAEKAERDAAETKAELIRERLGRRFHLDDDDLELLGTGTEEQLTARAERIKAKNDALAAASGKSDAPPSDRPTQKLRPGASPVEAPPADTDAYPAHWRK